MYICYYICTLLSYSDMKLYIHYSSIITSGQARTVQHFEYPEVIMDEYRYYVDYE